MKFNGFHRLLNICSGILCVFHWCSLSFMVCACFFMVWVFLFLVLHLPHTRAHGLRHSCGSTSNWRFLMRRPPLQKCNALVRCVCCGFAFLHMRKISSPRRSSNETSRFFWGGRAAGCLVGPGGPGPSPSLDQESPWKEKEKQWTTRKPLKPREHPWTDMKIQDKSWNFRNKQHENHWMPANQGKPRKINEDTWKTSTATKNTEINGKTQRIHYKLGAARKSMNKNEHQKQAWKSMNKKPKSMENTKSVKTMTIHKHRRQHLKNKTKTP